MIEFWNWYGNLSKKTDHNFSNFKLSELSYIINFQDHIAEKRDPFSSNVDQSVRDLPHLLRWFPLISADNGCH